MPSFKIWPASVTKMDFHCWGGHYFWYQHRLMQGAPLCQLLSPQPLSCIFSRQHDLAVSCTDSMAEECGVAAVRLCEHIDTPKHHTHWTIKGTQQAVTLCARWPHYRQNADSVSLPWIRHCEVCNLLLKKTRYFCVLKSFLGPAWWKWLFTEHLALTAKIGNFWGFKRRLSKERSRKSQEVASTERRMWCGPCFC
jgi:hypothetical protein